MAKTALITGASEGIGYELAKIFAREKFSLVLVARNEAKLRSLAEELRKEFSVESHVLAFDLSEPDAAEKLAHAVEQRELRIDVLVNNAGFGGHGLFHEQDEGEIFRMMQLNMVTLAMLTRKLLPQMVAQGSGRILNVASTASFQPGPLMAVYYATKSFVLSLSEALATELRHVSPGVTVTALCPGPTRTEFQQRAGITELSFFKGNAAMDARTVAEQGFSGMMKGKRTVVPGILNKIMAFSTRFSPRTLSAGIVWNIQKKRK